MKHAPQTVEAVNELWLPSDPGYGLRTGEIYAANEARFVTANYSEPLTGYLVGWKEPENLQQLLEDIAPIVPVPRRFEYKAATNAEAFLSEPDDVRAIGSAFKRVSYTGSTVNESTLNKGLTTRIDKDEQLDGMEEERAAGRLTQRLLRNEIRRVLALIAAAATNAAKTWSAATNPDKDIRDAIKLAADASGIGANRVLYSEAAWLLRRDAYELQNTPAAGRAADKTPEQLAAQFMVDKVTVSKARYQSTLTAKASVMTASTVLLYNALVGASKDDPSNVKRFVTPMGVPFRVYRQESDKWVDISVEHYSKGVITSTLGVRQITASA